MKKVPPQDEIIIYGGQKIKFKVIFDRVLDYHVNIQVNNTATGKTPFSGRAFSHEHSFETGDHDVEITIIEMDETVDAWSLEDGMGFHWSVTAIDPNLLFGGDIDRAKRIILDVITLASGGAMVAPKLRDKIREYYEDRTEVEKATLREQTEIEDFLEDT